MLSPPEQIKTKKSLISAQKAALQTGWQYTLIKAVTATFKPNKLVLYFSLIIAVVFSLYLQALSFRSRAKEM